MYCKSLVLIFSTFVALAFAAIKFTNIKCEEVDPTFYNVTKCELKLIRRGATALDIYAQLLQKPVTNLTVNASFFKKANGYRPFLYNITANLCDYMKNKKKYPVLKFALDILKDYSTFNHTCPYGDIIVHNMVLSDSMIKNLPLPGGEYMIHIVLYAYNVARGACKAYFLIK